MRKFALIPLVLVAAGCASGSVNTRLDSIEAELRDLRALVTRTNELAGNAQSSASDANSAAGEARRLAQRALDAANAANERASRIAEEISSK